VVRVLEVLNSLNGRRPPVDGVPDQRSTARCNAEARRLACDACIVPLVLGSDSMPLDVGRQQRLATTALRDAL
jgi:hypothetical protein